MSLIPPKPKKKPGMPKLSIPSRPTSSSSTSNAAGPSNQPLQPPTLSIPTSTSNSSINSNSNSNNSDFTNLTNLEDENQYEGSTGSGFISTAPDSIYPDTVPGQRTTIITNGDGMRTIVADQSALTNDLRRAIGGMSLKDRDRDLTVIKGKDKEELEITNGDGPPTFLKLPVVGSSKTSSSSSGNLSRTSDGKDDSTSTSTPNPDPSSTSSPQNQNDVAENGVEEELVLKGNFEFIARLGEGASGEVKKVRHKPTGLMMAKKTISTSPNPDIHRQILRELSFNRTCHSEFIVKYYGAFLDEEDTSIEICMEYCEAGSLDAIYKKVKSRNGRTGEKVLGRISECVLKGLGYLHERKIIHRDIKPSNIVVTRQGQIKLCDFGVSGELINSMAGTFTGTSYYMAPERIKGLPYSISSDVWSLGLTILEIASNRFPFPGENEPPLGPIDLLSYVVNMKVPELQDDESSGIKWSKSLKDFIERCLEKDGMKRFGPNKMLNHPFIKKSMTRIPQPNLEKFVAEVWGWNYIGVGGGGNSTPITAHPNNNNNNNNVNSSTPISAVGGSTIPFNNGHAGSNLNLSGLRQAPNSIVTKPLDGVNSTSDGLGVAQPIEIKPRLKLNDDRTQEEIVEARLREADVGLIGSPTE